MPPKKKGKEKKEETALAVPEEKNALAHRLSDVLTEEQKELIKRCYAKNATDDELAIYFNFCEKAGVDPLRGQSHFIKYKPTDKPIMMIGIDGFQARAISDPRYEGMAANAVYENDKFSMNPVEGIIEHSFGVKDRGAIAGAYAILKRKGMPDAVIWVNFKEYDLNRNLWTSKKEVMIVKVSKATLLRREYPDSFSNVFIPEEFGAEITDKGDFVDITPKKPAKQPKAVKRCKDCKGALPNDNESGYCALCFANHGPIPVEKEIKEAEFTDEAEQDAEPFTKEGIVETETESEPEEESTLTIIPKEIINDIKKPRDALEKILEYTVKHELGSRVKPVVISHYKAWETGEPSLCNIPETNIIRIVESLTGVKLKKKEKSHKCDCGKHITEAELEERDGFCMVCWKEMESKED